MNLKIIIEILLNSRHAKEHRYCAIIVTCEAPCHMLLACLILVPTAGIGNHTPLPVFEIKYSDVSLLCDAIQLQWKELGSKDISMPFKWGSTNGING